MTHNPPKNSEIKSSIAKRQIPNLYSIFIKKTIKNSIKLVNNFQKGLYIS